MPPSKSVTNRALNLALLADGPSEIVRPLEADDTEAMVGALERVGFVVEAGLGVLAIGSRRPVPSAEIDCRASGTMLRFLAASLAAIPGDWVLDGTARLRERPMAPLLDALRRLGAGIECLEIDGFAPIRIRGGSLHGGHVILDAGSSSQFLSALLMASVRAVDPVSVEVTGLASAPYVDLTLQAMADFGLQVERRGDLFVVEPRTVPGARFEVEGDFSSACYFGAAAALTGGCVRLGGLRADSRQGDRRFFEVLERMGAETRWLGDELEVRGPDSLTGVAENLGDLPDQAPTLAVLGPFASGETRITGVGHVRLKESDRLRVVARELGRTGVSNVREKSDSLEVPGVWCDQPPPSGAVAVHPADDHRIAMAFALLGLRRPGVSIADPEVVAKSYPEFWNDLESICSA